MFILRKRKSDLGDNLYSVHLPPFCWGQEGGRGLSLLPNFQNRGGGLTGPPFVEGGCWERGGDFFLGGVAIFSTKNKLKSGIFNDKKKVYKQEHFAVVTKNSNWEIFSTNLVTFKR